MIGTTTRRMIQWTWNRDSVCSEDESTRVNMKDDRENSGVTIRINTTTNLNYCVFRLHPHTRGKRELGSKILPLPVWKSWADMIKNTCWRSQYLHQIVDDLFWYRTDLVSIQRNIPIRHRTKNTMPSHRDRCTSATQEKIKWTATLCSMWTPDDHLPGTMPTPWVRIAMWKRMYKMLHVPPEVRRARKASSLSSTDPNRQKSDCRVHTASEMSATKVQRKSFRSTMPTWRVGKLASKLQPTIQAAKCGSSSQMGVQQLTQMHTGFAEKRGCCTRNLGRCRWKTTPRWTETNDQWERTWSAMYQMGQCGQPSSNNSTRPQVQSSRCAPQPHSRIHATQALGSPAGL